MAPADERELLSLDGLTPVRARGDLVLFSELSGGSYHLSVWSPAGVRRLPIDPSA